MCISMFKYILTQSKLANIPPKYVIFISSKPNQILLDVAFLFHGYLSVCWITVRAKKFKNFWTPCNRRMGRRVIYVALVPWYAKVHKVSSHSTKGPERKLNVFILHY